MNYVGHLFVAGEIDPGSGLEFGVGAMLPDLAHLAGSELKTDVLGYDPVSWGIMLHDHTNGVFHENPAFQELDGQAAEHLAGVLPEAAARACAHTGVELMLDGVILDRRGVAERYRAAAQWIQQNYQKLGNLAPQPDQLANYLDDLSFFGGVPVHYRSARGTAVELYRRLQANPALAFDANLVNPLAEVLEVDQAQVRIAAGSLIASVLQAIRQN